MQRHGRLCQRYHGAVPPESLVRPARTSFRVPLGFAEPGCTSLFTGALAPLLATLAFPPESAPADSLVGPDNHSGTNSWPAVLALASRVGDRSSGYYPDPMSETPPTNAAPSDRFSRDLYMRAWHFAARRHNGQKVPASDLPYITHIGAVAMEVLATLAIENVPQPDLAVACALLHDTIEDTGATREDIAAEFGAAVADGVVALSKDKHLPKDQQMADSLERIKRQPREIWIVKLADRTVNMEPAPATWSPEKRIAYRAQANLILEELGGASPALAARLRDKIHRYAAGVDGNQA